jgi:predicted amidohydrolase YtcJ
MMSATLLFENGRIYPLSRPPIDDGALLVEDDRIAYVGPRQHLGTVGGQGLRRIDLGGRALLPGLCDSHLHLMETAEWQDDLDLLGCECVDDVCDRLRERARRVPARRWIAGFGWERQKLFRNCAPSATLLDRVSPEHPVFLVSKDLHCVWLNSLGMGALRSLSRMPAACDIDRDEHGETGLCFEAVLDLRSLLIPPRTAQAKKRLFDPCIRSLYSCGITAVHCFGELGSAQLFREHMQQGGERIRALWNYILNLDELETQLPVLDEVLPGWLHRGNVKLFLDGSFGSWTAALSRPYVGRDDRGLLNMSGEELQHALRRLQSHGLKAAIHAIGDRALETALEALATMDGGFDGHRIEHAQLVTPDILRRYDLRGLHVSMQPSHMWSDRELVRRHLPAELRDAAYPLADLWNRGANICFSSDAPVEKPDPLKGILAAVHRRVGEDTVWNAAQCLSLHQALEAHSTNPARLPRAPGAGELRVGLPADLIVLAADPQEIVGSPDQEPGGGWPTDLTFLEGHCVYKR